MRSLRSFSSASTVGATEYFSMRSIPRRIACSTPTHGMWHVLHAHARHVARACACARACAVCSACGACVCIRYAYGASAVHTQWACLVHVGRVGANPPKVAPRVVPRVPPLRRVALALLREQQHLLELLSPLVQWRALPRAAHTLHAHGACALHVHVHMHCAAAGPFHAPHMHHAPTCHANVSTHGSMCSRLART